MLSASRRNKPVGGKNNVKSVFLAVNPCSLVFLLRIDIGLGLKRFLGFSSSMKVGRKKSLQSAAAFTRHV